MAAVKLADIIEHENLENLTPEIDIKKIKVTQPDINRPALQMAGYFEHFEATRLQIIGFVEYSYMESLTETRQEIIYERLLRLWTTTSRRLRTGMICRLILIWAAAQPWSGACYVMRDTRLRI